MAKATTTGRLTEHELEILRDLFADTEDGGTMVSVQSAKLELLSNNIEVPLGRYFDEKLIRSGCVLENRSGIRFITALPKKGKML
jgi:hypothetical protein